MGVGGWGATSRFSPRDRESWKFDVDAASLGADICSTYFLKLNLGVVWACSVDFGVLWGGGAATFPFSFPPVGGTDGVGLDSEGEDLALWGVLALQFFWPSGGLDSFVFGAAEEAAEEVDGLLVSDREDSDFWGLWGF